MQRVVPPEILSDTGTGPQRGYNPRFRVTDTVSHRYGDRRERQEKLARYAAPVRPGEHESNREILFGKVPKHVAVKRVAHDAVLQMYMKDLEYSQLGEEPEPEEARGFLEDLVDDKHNRSDHLHHSISRLNRTYGVRTGEVLEQEIEGRTMEEFFEETSDWYTRNRPADTTSALRWEPEVGVKSRRLSGRADLVVYRPGRNEVWDVKLSTGDHLPLERHRDQVLKYAWQLDATPVLDYPLEGRRALLDYDRASVSDRILEDVMGFSEDVKQVRHLHSREMERITGIEREEESLEEYRLRIHRGLSPMASEKTAREALEEALKTV